VSGNQRTVNFIVRPNSAFPVLGANDISQYASDATGNVAGWVNNDLNFSSQTTQTITCPANQSVCGSQVVNYSTPTSTCNTTVVRNAGLASGSTFPVGVNTVTYNTYYPNGAGGYFTYAPGATNQQIALAAAESVYGVGACSIGSCGNFTYYYKTTDLNCNCGKAVGSYEFIYSNTGYTYVGEDYGGTRLDNVAGNQLFVRVKTYSNCTSGPSWTLAEPALGQGGATGSFTVTVDAPSSYGALSTTGPVKFCSTDGSFSPAVSISGYTGTATVQYGSNNGGWYAWLNGATSGTCCFPKQVSSSDATADRIKFIVTNGVCPASTSPTVLISDYYSEAPSTLTSNLNNVCPGTTVTLTATFPSAVNMRGTVEFSTSLNGSAFASITPVTGQTVFTTALVPPAGTTTTYYARYNASGNVAGCYSTSASVAVTVYANVSITSATAAASPICANATTTITANGVTGTGATLTWWTGTGGTGSNLGSTNPLNVGPGTYYARVTGTCGSPVEASVTVVSTAIPAITSVTAAANPICANSTTTLTANGVAGAGATVTWYSGAGGTGTNYGTGLTSVRGPGTYYARVTGTCTPPVEASITINSTAIPAITSVTAAANPICANATTTLTANGVVGAGATVTWYSGAGGTGTNYGTGLTSVRGPGTYYARVTGTCTPPVEASITIISTAIPAITSVTAAANPICANVTTTLTANGVAGAGATVTWWSGTGGTGTNYGSGLTLANASPGTYYARVTGTCTPAVEASVTIIGNPLPVAAGNISGPATAYKGQVGVPYNVPVITNATSYTWAYSGTGATITGTTNNITITFGSTATSGNLTVYGVNSCGNGTISANYLVTIVDPVFYSKSSGNLNDFATWGTGTDGTGLAPTGFTTANQIFNIRNNATPTLGAAWTVSGTGSKVVVGNGTNALTFTIPSGIAYSAVSTEISNAGTVKNQNSSVTSLGTCSVLSGGTYEHNINGGTIPSATWNASSNLIISGITSATALTNLNQAYGNMQWNSASQSSVFGANVSFTIAGNMTITSTGTGEFVLATSAAPTITVNGNYNQSGGIFNLSNTSSFGARLNIGGNFNQTAGTITTSGSPSGTNGFITFNKSSGTNTYSQSSVVSGSYTKVEKTGGSTMQLNSDATWPNVLISGGVLDFLTTARILTISGSSISFAGSTVNMSGGNAAHKIKCTSGSSPSISFPTTWTHGTGDVFEFANTAGSINLNQTTTFNHLVVTNAGTTINLNSDGTPRTYTANGNVTVIAGALNINNGNAATSFNVAQDVLVSGGTLAVGASSAAVASTLNIANNFTISGGTVNIASATNAGVVFAVFAKNVQVSSGTLNLNNYNSSSNNAGRLFVSGDFVISGGSLLNSPAISTGSAGIYFNSTGVQNLTLSGVTLTSVSGSIGRRFYYSTNTPPVINETYNGSSAQYTVNGSEGTPASAGTFAAWPTATTGIGVVNNLTINNTVGVTLSSSKQVNGIVTIGSGAGLTSTSTTELKVGGNWINNGSFTHGSGTVTFNGTTAQEIKAGNSGFYNVVFNNGSTGSDKFNISQPMTINKDGTFTNGLVYYSGTGSLSFSNGSSSNGGSATSFVRGTVAKSGYNAFTFPIGSVSKVPVLPIVNTPPDSALFAIWAPIGISAPALTCTTPFTATYIRSAAPANWNPGCMTGLLDHTSGVENWELTGGCEVKLTLFWKEHAWSSITSGQESNLLVAHWNTTLQKWEDLGMEIGSFHTANGLNSITSNLPTTSFSPFTFGGKQGTNNPLPIQLTEFKGICKGDSRDLLWKTASEINNDYFTIESSKNGLDWTFVTKVPGSGNSNMEKSYSFSDLTSEPVLYYRLTQTDFNGQFKTFDPIVVNCADIKDKSISIFPNPFQSLISVSLLNISDENITVNIYDMFGKLIEKSTYRISNGFNNMITLDMGDLPAGVYYLEVKATNYVKSTKVVKNK
jgi:hypothetical protein